MSKLQKIIYIGFSFKHHGKYSGYNQIKRYLKYDKLIDYQLSYQILLVLKKYKIFKPYIKIVGTYLWWVELRLIFISLFHPKNYIFHFVYAENLFRWLGFFKRKNIVVLTLHQPVAFFQNEKNEKILNRIKTADMLIVMSEALEDFFRKTFPQIQVKFIPHGIDVNYFSINNSKKNQVMVSGSWLRDFSFASSVFTEIEKRKSDLKIVVLTNPENFHYFSQNKVTLLHNIDDLSLLKLYQESKVLYLPLTEFTANNAMLEGLACGCNVIVSTDEINIPTDNKSPIVFIDRKPALVVNQILRSIKSEDDNYMYKNRDYVMKNFDWRLIVQETKSFMLSEY